MTTRVSDGQRFQTNLGFIQRARARVQTTQGIASSGMKHVTGSDDPAWQRLKSANENRQSTTGQSLQNVKNGRQRLDASDGALDSATNLLMRAQELAVQLGSGTYGAADRQGGAEEIAGLRETLLGVANTKTTDGFVFAGFQTDAPAFDAGGVIQGDTGDKRVDAGDGKTASTSVNGQEAFQSSVDVFAVLAQLEIAMRSNDPTSIRAQISAVDASIDQVTNARASVGARMQVLDQLSARLQDAQAQLDEQHANTIEADPVEAYSNLTQASAALEASLKVSASAMQKSLLDYI